MCNRLVYSCTYHTTCTCVVLYCHKVLYNNTNNISQVSSVENCDIGKLCVPVGGGLLQHFVFTSTQLHTLMELQYCIVMQLFNDTTK